MKITIVCDVLGKENNGTTIAAMTEHRHYRKKINHATHRLLVAFCDNLLYNKSMCCQQATKGGLYL